MEEGKEGGVDGRRQTQEPRYHRCLSIFNNYNNNKKNFVPPILYSLSFTKTELTFHILIYEFWAHGFPYDM